ncbi:MAG: hypothetical protein V4564_20165 [Pseudomonadota bacterium]
MAASQFKYSLKRGQTAKDVVISAGTTIAGSDAVELNVDATNMTEMEFYALMEELEIAYINAKYPAL